MLSTFVIGLLLSTTASGNSLSRIIGGTDTTLQYHPHQVSLQVSGSHICGASIIADQWVLTAAHCVDLKGPYTYRIDLNDGTLNGKWETYDASRIIKHPGYDGRVTSSGAYPNDIALIKLTRAINFGYGHKIINMANTGQNFDGVTCTITGWGNTVTGSGTNIPNKLQQTGGVIYTENECKQVWGSNYNHDVHICIHDTKSGSCNGDSGGPMVCDEVLAGVTSWGINGCDPAYPSVYARLSSYRSWIDTTMSTN